MLAAHQGHLREDFPLSSLREAPLELQTHPRPCTQPAPLKAPVFYVKLRKATFTHLVACTRADAERRDGLGHGSGGSCLEGEPFYNLHKSIIRAGLVLPSSPVYFAHCVLGSTVALPVLVTWGVHWASCSSGTRPQASG